MAGIAKDSQKSLEESEGAKVIEFAPDASAAPDRSGDMWLASEPCHQTLSSCFVPC